MCRGLTTRAGLCQLLQTGYTLACHKLEPRGVNRLGGSAEVDNILDSQHVRQSKLLVDCLGQDGAKYAAEEDLERNVLIPRKAWGQL